jgi:hypothetical protein
MCVVLCSCPFISLETYSFLVLTEAAAVVQNSAPEEHRLRIINCFNISQVRARIGEEEVGRKEREEGIRKRLL